ncbi:hypothetical protein QFW77_16680 [Luteimonas sp. RD2P54]|uniref:DUF2141 domain-containing protein n=1 Tax=Luteimonas endophytica TaxID=3042023 RepID=A0ABT6JEJ0_9GAMM|nr:hypothetical protein [Luteimonas endophytica]MDH5824608.1 hypothetical protein [Luteimonas endophytica]
MKIPTPTLALVLAAALPAAGDASAVEPELGAEQVNIDTTGLLALGGSVHQRLAQAFELHEPGLLSHLMLPLSCQPKATVYVTIEKTSAGVPNGSVLAEEKVPGYVFTSIPTPAVGMRMVEFTKPAKLDPGLYAFTLTAYDGDCGAYVGPPGNSYPAGRGYFIADGNGPAWIELFDAAGVRDMAFQVHHRPL